MKSRTLRTILNGVLAGGAATLPMSALMLAAGKAGLIPLQPPERITAEALEFMRLDVSESTKDALSMVDHFAFGATAGALFVLLHRKLDLPIAASTQGVFFGLAVWLASYEGWVPALRIMPPVEHDHPGRPASMAVAHVVYGAVLGGVLKQLERRGKPTA
jgi:uncharacterized membrane protein YagU involved in acid resistance